MVSLPTPICVTRPQWVKQRMATKCIVYFTNVWSTEIAVIDFPAGSFTILQSLVRCVCHQTWYTFKYRAGCPLIYTINHISFLLTILHTISSNISYHPGYYAKTLRLWIYELHIKNDWLRYIFLISLKITCDILISCSLNLIVGLSNICI